MTILRGFCIMAVLTAAAFVSAATPSAADSGRGLSFSGVGSIEAGQLVKWQFRGGDSSHTWVQQSKVRLVADKKINSWMNVLLGFEGAAWYDTYDTYSNNPIVTPKEWFTFIIHQSEAFFNFGDALKIDCGVFPYKYNPNAQNLGEYVFRSGAYPGFLVTEFDFPLVRLTGLRLNNRLFGKLDQDLIINMETEYKPFHDFTVSYIGAVTPHPALTVGAGISFSHLISVNEKYTTPKTPGTQYVDNPDTLKTASGTDSIVGDTVSLTFRGIKVMGRICVDIKSIFPWSAFGPEDCKLYGEATILGVKSYKLYYDTLWQRIPIMFGINIPAFKLLDVLSLEAEWYGSPYPNNYQKAFSITVPPSPVPDGPAVNYSADVYRTDNWKWSVYAKKTIWNSFGVIGQLARDHFRTRANNPYNDEREESLTKNEQWYWMLKLAYSF